MSLFSVYISSRLSKIKGAYMKRTEWDKFNDDENLCKRAGCQNWNISVCCPELMTCLCKPKQNLLKKLNINEDELEEGKLTVEHIKDKLRNK